MHRRVCSECRELREHTEYTADEWRRGDEVRECNACLRARRQRQLQQRREKARRCAGCGEMKDDFLSDQLHQGDAKLCKTCLSKQQKASADAAMQARLAMKFTCKECKVPKNCTSFPPKQSRDTS